MVTSTSPGASASTSSMARARALAAGTLALEGTLSDLGNGLSYC